MGRADRLIGVRIRARLGAGCSLVLLGVLFSEAAFGWGVGHRIITEAALGVQPRSLFERWQVLHRNAFLEKEESIAWYVANHFSKHPDWVDGPSRTGEDLEERVRIKAFVYAESEGRYTPAITYAGPDRVASKGFRPKTYHYFTFQTEEVNREFARKGSRWYFEKISTAFREGNDIIAAEYFGAFAHAIQDRVSPFHVWDGYTGEREAFEDSLAGEGLQSEEGSRNGNPGYTSLFWTVGGKGMTPNLEGYQPRSLGDSAESASEEFVRRLFASREYAESIYTDREGFIAAHLEDDWKERGSSVDTDRFLTLVAEENAKLTADVLFTAFSLASDE